MFDIAPTELLLCAIVALVVIGPKDLPRAMRTVGQFVAKARGIARHFRSGFDEMVREAELAEMEAAWAKENARIMREHPPEEAHDAALARGHDGARDDGTGHDAPVAVDAPRLTDRPGADAPADGPSSHDPAASAGATWARENARIMGEHPPEEPPRSVDRSATAAAADGPSAASAPAHPGDRA